MKLIVKRNVISACSISVIPLPPRWIIPVSRHPLSRSCFEPGQIAWDLSKVVVGKGVELIRLLCPVLSFSLFAVFIVSDLYKIVWCGWVHHMLNNRCLSAAQAVPINQERHCSAHPTCAGISCSWFFTWARKCHSRCEHSTSWWQGWVQESYFVLWAWVPACGGTCETTAFFWNADVKYGLL